MTISMLNRIIWSLAYNAVFVVPLVALLMPVGNTELIPTSMALTFLTLIAEFLIGEKHTPLSQLGVYLIGSFFGYWFGTLIQISLQSFF